MSSYKNFSIKDRQFRDSDTFKRPDLFETNKVNEQILKDFKNIKKNGVNYVVILDIIQTGFLIIYQR